MEYITPYEFVTDRKTTCCITGHRRRDLPFKGDVTKQGARNFFSNLALLCNNAYKEGYRTFISGMAEGVDLACAQIILEMKRQEKYKGISLVCALPYEKQINEMTEAIDRYNYGIVLRVCDCIVVTGKQNDKNRYRIRNQFMVNNSSRVIGAYKKKTTGSGTLQTLNMAKRAGLDIKIIELEKNPLYYVEADDGLDKNNIVRIQILNNNM